MMDKIGVKNPSGTGCSCQADPAHGHQQLGEASFLHRVEEHVRQALQGLRAGFH